MPSVTTSILVLPDTLVSRRVRYPTVCPGASPNCFAIYRAADLAASRLGSNIRIFRLSRQGASNRASGTLVVLPAPGGAWSNAVVLLFRVCFSSGSMCSIGSIGFGWVLVGFSPGVLGVARGCLGFFGRKRTRFAQTPLFGQKNLNTPTPCVTLRVYPEVTMVVLGLSRLCRQAHPANYLFQRNRRGQLERGGGVFFSAGNECLSAASFISKAKNTPPPRSILHNPQSGSTPHQDRERHKSARGTKNANKSPNASAATPIPKADPRVPPASSHCLVSHGPTIWVKP